MKGSSLSCYRQLRRARTGHQAGVATLTSACLALAGVCGSQCFRDEKVHCQNDKSADYKEVQQKNIDAAFKPAACPKSDAHGSSFPKSNAFQRLFANSLRITNLPIPRIIQPADKTFEWPALKRGLRQRARDEDTMRKLTKNAQEAAHSGDPNEMGKIMAALCEVAYGKGVTPQDRQDFLVVGSVVSFVCICGCL
jgi:hypothetical protein